MINQTYSSIFGTSGTWFWQVELHPVVPAGTYRNLDWEVPHWWGCHILSPGMLDSLAKILPR